MQPSGSDKKEKLSTKENDLFRSPISKSKYLLPHTKLTLVCWHPNHIWTWYKMMRVKLGYFKWDFSFLVPCFELLLNLQMLSGRKVQAKKVRKRNMGVCSCDYSFISLYIHGVALCGELNISYCLVFDCIYNNWQIAPFFLPKRLLFHQDLYKLTSINIYWAATIQY